MGDIVNLNQFRKSKAKSDNKATAALNRAKFGRPKVVRETLETNEQRRIERLDEHRKVPDGRTSTDTSASPDAPPTPRDTDKPDA